MLSGRAPRKEKERLGLVRATILCPCAVVFARTATEKELS